MTLRAFVVAGLLALLLTGATCQRRAALPVPAQCNAICFSPCATSGDTGVRWEADPNDPAAWDALGADVTLVLAERLRTCDEGHRDACVQCLRRLERAGVITLGEP